MIQSIGTWLDNVTCVNKSSSQMRTSMYIIYRLAMISCRRTSPQHANMKSEEYDINILEPLYIVHVKFKQITEPVSIECQSHVKSTAPNPQHVKRLIQWETIHDTLINPFPTSRSFATSSHEYALSFLV